MKKLLNVIKKIICVFGGIILLLAVQASISSILRLINPTEEDREEKKELEQTTSDNKDLLDFMKDALKDEVAEVKISNRLSDDPVCLTAGEGVSFEMEKVFANMPEGNGPMGGMKAERILELNPNHPIFQTLKTLFMSDKEKVKEVAEVLYDQALLIEGFPIEDPIAYSRKICELLVNTNK